MTRAHVDPKLEQIYEQAALWMLRKQDKGLNRAERRRYAQWLELPGRAEAMRRMQAFSVRLHQPRPRQELAAKFVFCS